MKIFVIGSRGIPNIQGGVETHCEELYPIIAKNPNVQVTVIGRNQYGLDGNITKYKGVSIKNLYAPKNSTLEAIVHSFLAVIYSCFKRPDIVHIHAVGPSLVAPIARLFGLKVIMTHHGPDYARKKWGWFAKKFLKIGEWAGVRFANEVIVISPDIRKSLEVKYNRLDSHVIPNGVTHNEVKFDIKPLEEYNLTQHKYIFTLGRFVPEKGFDYLIRAFRKANIGSDIKLVIAGDADHESDYSKELKSLAIQEGIVLTGFIKGNRLVQLFSNSGLFILPSFYEGLPISLLEAMSYNLPILASDISANKQIDLPEQNFFAVGNESILTMKILEWYNSKRQENIYNMDMYDWKRIAKDTQSIYDKIYK